MDISQKPGTLPLLCLTCLLALGLLASRARAASQGDVVFNEVAWMGSASSYMDEWIELYNNSGQAISLADWQIVEGTITRTIEAADCPDGSCTIGAGSLFLIERREDSVSDISADALVSLNLNNDGEPLELLDDQGARIDFMDTTTSWYAGELSGHLTMERINPAGPSADGSNWATNDGQTINGLDSGSVPVKGTPRSMNSAYDAGCSPENSQEDCYSGPAGTAGVGICTEGTRTCISAVWGPCQDQQLPQGEDCYNGLDDDCDSFTDDGDSDCAGACADSDSDGHQDHACGGPDCDDSDPTTHPGADEACDLKDNNCDGATDEDLGSVTCGQGACQVTQELCLAGLTQTCQPGSPPEEPEQSCADGIDNDCDGWTDGEDQNCGSACDDSDNDGYAATNCGGDDCDDSEAAIHPGANEMCSDGRDNNCDGLTDGADPTCPAECQDADGDGYPSAACGGSDCDDTEDLIHPGIVEICSDFIDNDCDGFVDINDLDCAGIGGDEGGCSCGQKSPLQNAPLLLLALVCLSLFRRRHI